MARKNREEQIMNTENTENAVDPTTVTPADAVDQVTEVTETPAVPATPEEPKVDERYKMVTLKDGTVMKRKDFILQRWTVDKKSRGDIAKELTELTGKKIPYQIVFAGTKGVKGGPDKAPETPAAPAPEVAQTPSEG